jgi:hypothetical protein
LAVAVSDNMPITERVQPNLNAASIDAVPLTNDSVALSWAASQPAYPYRIYSDMGGGYGLYVYKAQTTQPLFVDEMLRPGISYTYWVTRLGLDRERVLARAAATTFTAVAATDVPAAEDEEVVAPALPSDAILLSLLSDNKITDNFGTMTIVGEVRNDTSLHGGQAQITVTFYDVTGKVVGVTTGKTVLAILPPGGVSPFLITLNRPAGMNSYSLRAVARPATPELAPQLAVGQTRRTEDEAGFLRVKGTLENVGTRETKRTRVAVVLYGRSGRVINVGFAYVTPLNLAPGAEATYEVVFSHYAGYASHKVIPFEE